MRLGVDSVQYDGDMWQEFGDDIKCTCLKLRVSACAVDSTVGGVFENGFGGGLGFAHSPHTRQRENSISASGSLMRFRLIAIADCPIMIVPTWCPTLTGEILGR